MALSGCAQGILLRGHQFTRCRLRPPLSFAHSGVSRCKLRGSRGPMAPSLRELSAKQTEGVSRCPGGRHGIALSSARRKGRKEAAKEPPWFLCKPPRSSDVKKQYGTTALVNFLRKFVRGGSFSSLPKQFAPWSPVRTALPSAATEQQTACSMHLFGGMLCAPTSGDGGELSFLLQKSIKNIPWPFGEKTRGCEKWFGWNRSSAYGAMLMLWGTGCRIRALLLQPRLPTSCR